MVLANPSQNLTLTPYTAVWLVVSLPFLSMYVVTCVCVCVCVCICARWKTSCVRLVLLCMIWSNARHAA